MARPRSTPFMLVALASVLACDSVESPTGVDAPTEPPVAPGGVAFAMGRWSPSSFDTCSKEIHDAWSTVGPDGKLYPTWHPPVDPVTGCTFGHEHGRDPRQSDLYNAVGKIPFGYANEYLTASGFVGERHEDHVGHKIEWENDIEMRLGAGGSAVFDISCDVMTKLHQGTHSPDAYTNNMHEVVYHIRCTDGSGFSATLLTPIGRAGELVASCERDRRHVAGPPTPITSPDGGGRRAIPDMSCVQSEIVNRLGAGDRARFGTLRESWEINGRLKSESGKTLVSFNPYFQVMDPSRFFDPTVERALGRPVDLCAIPGAEERSPCEGVPAGTSWDSPASPFVGADRFVDINANRVRNDDGPQTWYTDPLGGGGRPFPFPGSIRQWIAQIDNSALDLHGPVIGKSRDYGGLGVHAPN